MAQETLVHVFWERVQTTPERPAIFHKVAGSFRPVIWREHGRVVELVAGGLLKAAVMPGEKVAILSNSRPQWTWSDMAILSAGAVTVPIYPTLAAPEIEYLLRHSDSVGVIAENQTQVRKLLSLKEPPEGLKFIVVMEGEPPVERLAGVRMLKWEDLLKDGEVFLPAHPQALTERIDGISPETLATIVYTSGTTGVPKGAMLLHGNLYAVCRALSHFVGFHPDDLGLSFLPLAHVYERVGGQFVAIYEGLIAAYAESMDTVAQDLVEMRPTILNGVPRFFEKVYHRIQSEVRQMPKAQQYLIRWALALGKRAARYKEHTVNGATEIVRKIYRAELRVAERLVFSRIRRRFGGRVRFMCSGAAPLSPDVHLFFETIGIPIIEGYGLTETSAPVTCNTPNGIKRGTVGRPLPGVEVKIAEDGEIMVRGPNVFAGYYKDEQATRQAFRDGWF
ncbi:MAG TPA: AMP-binding protein, partial [Candidatus Obscuribacterales bacterium]